MGVCKPTVRTEKGIRKPSEERKIKEVYPDPRTPLMSVCKPAVRTQKRTQKPSEEREMKKV